MRQDECCISIHSNNTPSVGTSHPIRRVSHAFHVNDSLKRVLYYNNNVSLKHVLYYNNNVSLKHVLYNNNDDNDTPRHTGHVSKGQQKPEEMKFK